MITCLTKRSAGAYNEGAAHRYRGPRRTTTFRGDSVQPFIKDLLLDVAFFWRYRYQPACKWLVTKRKAHRKEIAEAVFKRTGDNTLMRAYENLKAREKKEKAAAKKKPKKVAEPEPEPEKIEVTDILPEDDEPDPDAGDEDAPATDVDAVEPDEEEEEGEEEEENDETEADE